MSLEKVQNGEVRDRRIEGLAAIFRIKALGKGGSKEVQHKASHLLSELTTADRRGIENVLRSRNDDNLEFLLKKLFPERVTPGQTPPTPEIPSHRVHATVPDLMTPEEPISTLPKKRETTTEEAVVETADAQ